MDTSCDVGTLAADLRARYSARVNMTTLHNDVWWYDSENVREKESEKEHLIVRES